ncbi:MAG: hypothetical protein J4452_02715 [Candidatus Aenigmarchaeota archaeon]|nr:hypothetical protein [Candidatus Aenigmarchaeota archaeon]
MKIRSPGEIREDAAREYENDKHGWSVSIGRKSGFYDILMEHGSTLWQIKTDTLYKPTAMGVGVKIENVKIPASHVSPPNFGIRPAYGSMLERYEKDMESSDFPSEEILKAILSSPLVTVPELKDSGTPAAFIGPLKLSPSPLATISEAQRELDAQMETELDRMMRRKYGGMYG